MSEWYIYVHLKADNKEPFYVGKGKDRRAFVRRNRSAYWNRIVKKHGYIVDFVETGLTEEDANEKEFFWITTIGRRDLKEGTLVNFTNGGDGASGRPMNIKTKKILSIANKNRPTSQRQKSIVGSRYRGKSGYDHNKSKSVKCIETGAVWGSMSEAERELNLGGGAVSWSIKHRKPIYEMHFEIAN